MNGRSLGKFIPPAGPLLSLLLIGLVLLSALLYYRAVRIQRFLEPALALSQPRNEFTKNIKVMFQGEFGTDPVRGLKVKGSSIFVDKALLFSRNKGALTATAQSDLQKLARIFLSLMKNDRSRSEISLVLILGRFSSAGARGAYLAEKSQVQGMVGFIQDALFQLEPELGLRYATYFTGAIQPADPREGSRDVIEIRIIPSEFLHIEVLEKLEKYAN
jgi:hypothetical protein